VRPKTLNIPSLIRRLPAPLRRHKFIKALSFMSPETRYQVIGFNNRARFFGGLEDGAVRSVIINGAFEPEFFRLASPFLADGGVFVDVGANFGLCAFGMIAALGEAVRRVQFHLFEANPALCTCLVKSAELHPELDVRIQHPCVTDVPGRSHLAVEADSGKSFVTGDEGLAVSNLTLDDYVDTHRIPHVDFMKVDVEGWESRVLRGMKRQLSRGAVEAIYIEMISEHLSRAGTSASDVLRFLIDWGFTPYHCKDEDFRPAHRNTFDIPPGRRMRMTVLGRILAVPPVEMQMAAEGRFFTDILAVRRESCVVQVTDT
jgi:FkbM family methyltransferase